MLDNSTNPVGPYICKPNDGAHYDCCFGITVNCSGSDCCMADTNGNQFCASTCTNDSQCGAAHCHTYDNSHTSCSQTMACGP